MQSHDRMNGRPRISQRPPSSSHGNLVTVHSRQQPRPPASIIPENTSSYSSKKQQWQAPHRPESAKINHQINNWRDDDDDDDDTENDDTENDDTENDIDEDFSGVIQRKGNHTAMGFSQKQQLKPTAKPLLQQERRIFRDPSPSPIPQAYRSTTTPSHFNNYQGNNQKERQRSLPPPQTTSTPRNGNGLQVTRNGTKNMTPSHLQQQQQQQHAEDEQTQSRLTIRKVPRKPETAPVNYQRRQTTAAVMIPHIPRNYSSPSVNSFTLFGTCWVQVHLFSITMSPLLQRSSVAELSARYRCISYLFETMPIHEEWKNEVLMYMTGIARNDMGEEEENNRNEFKTNNRKNRKLSNFYMTNRENLLAVYFWHMHNYFNSLTRKPFFSIERYFTCYGIDLKNGLRLEETLLQRRLSTTK